MKKPHNQARDRLVLPEVTPGMVDAALRAFTPYLNEDATLDSISAREAVEDGLRAALQELFANALPSPKRGG